MPYDKKNQKFKGLCFVHFDTVDEAKAAFKNQEIRNKIFNLSKTKITLDYSNNSKYVNFTD
jgi:RNA recognition motif-containing protein